MKLTKIAVLIKSEIRRDLVRNYRRFDITVKQIKHSLWETG